MRVLGFVLALLAWMLVATVALAEEGRWQKLVNDPACVVWNGHPQEIELVSWSGACANGKAQGRGTVAWRYVEDGEWKTEKYIGEMKDGNQHGRGVAVFANGDRYEGGYKDGMMHGRGSVVWANGNRYEGEFEDHKKHGRGVFLWLNGDRYEGDWRNGKAHGRGTHYFADGRECEGDWREDNLIGKGRGWSDGHRMKCYLEDDTITFSD